MSVDSDRNLLSFTMSEAREWIGHSCKISGAREWNVLSSTMIGSGEGNVHSFTMSEATEWKVHSCTMSEDRKWSVHSLQWVLQCREMYIDLNLGRPGSDMYTALQCVVSGSGIYNEWGQRGIK